MKQMNYKFSLCLHAEALNKPSEIHIDTVKSLGGQVESSEIMETMETTEITKKTVKQRKNHNISTYPFLFDIRRFECYYTHCQETALN